MINSIVQFIVSLPTLLVTNTGLKQNKQACSAQIYLLPPAVLGTNNRQNTKKTLFQQKSYAATVSNFSGHSCTK